MCWNLRNLLIIHILAKNQNYNSIFFVHPFSNYQAIASDLQFHTLLQAFLRNLQATTFNFSQFKNDSN